jgi:hypothetical protein
MGADTMFGKFIGHIEIHIEGNLTCSGREYYKF